MAKRPHIDSDLAGPDGGGPGSATRVALLAVVYAAAAFLMLWRLYSAHFHYDSALTGLMAQSFLEGRFHPFFFGNNYMGTVDALLAAPLLLLLGPSSLAVNLWPPLIYLGTVALLDRSLKRLLGFWGRITGLAWLALPPAYGLFMAGEARTHYGLGMLLSALLLLLTLRIHQTRTLRARSAFAWGLVAGLAFWTNFLSAEMILPCALFLLLTRREALPPALAGAVLGAAPLLLYNLAQGWPHLGLAGDLRFGPELGMDQGLSLSVVLGYVEAIWRRGLPVMLGLISPHHGALAGGPNWWLLVFMAAALALAAAGMTLRGLTDPLRRGAAIPAALALLSLAAVALSHYGSQVEQARPRYLLWLLLALPFLWGWWGELLARARPALALALALALAVSNASLYQGFRGFWGDDILNTKGGYLFQGEPQAKQMLAKMRAQGITSLYAPERRTVQFRLNQDEGAYELAFLAGGQIKVAELWRDKRPRAAALVDASLHPAFLWGQLGPKANFLGLAYQKWGERVYYNFAEPRWVERRLEPRGWRAWDLAGNDLGAALWDQDCGTVYASQRGGHDEQGILVDLGAERVVAGLSMTPTSFMEVPRSLTVEAAGEDGVFRLLRRVSGNRVPFYVSGPHPFIKARYGRTECYFAPRRIRWLRLRQTGPSRHHWSVQELLLYGPGEPCRMGWEQSMDLALKAVRQAGLRRLYADAWPSARAYLALGKSVWTLPANEFSDVYGSDEPRLDRPLMLDPEPGSGLLLLRRQAAPAAKMLSRAGVDFSTVPAGRFILFLLHGLDQYHLLHLEGVHASRDPHIAAGLVQGHEEGERWASGRPQRPGVWLELDLGRPRQVAMVALHNPSHYGDHPRGLRAEVSEDGETWLDAPIMAAGPLAFSGQFLFLSRKARSLYRFTPGVRARYVRLVLDASDPARWWSVERVRVFGR